MYITLYIPIHTKKQIKLFALLATSSNQNSIYSASGCAFVFKKSERESKREKKMKKLARYKQSYVKRKREETGEK